MIDIVNCLLVVAILVSFILLGLYENRKPIIIVLFFIALAVGLCYFSSLP